MAGLNKVMLIGRLGQDPEIRYTQAGAGVCNFSLATSETWNDKNTGEKQEKTEWHRIVAFGKPAEILEKYLSKGSQVYIEGKLQTRSWEKEGQTHYTTDVVVSSFQFLGGGQNNQGQNQGYDQGGNQGNQYNRQPNNQGVYGGGNQQDDDIPF